MLTQDQDKGDYYHIICGNEKCTTNGQRLQDDVPKSKAPETIDAYNRFVDDFNKKIIG